MTEIFSVQHDALIRDFLTRLVGHASIPDKAWHQATLPIRRGGLGLTNASSLRHVAYVSSIADTLLLAPTLAIHFTNLLGPGTWLKDMCLQDASYMLALNDVTTLCASSPEDDIRRIPKQLGLRKLAKLQATLTTILVDQAFAKLKDSLSPNGRKRLNSCAQSEASAWLRAIPSDPSLFIANDPIKLRLCRWLGAPPPFLLPSKCSCGSKLDSPNAHHLEMCPNSRRIFVHDTMVSIIHRLLYHSGLIAPRKEVDVSDVFPLAGFRKFRIDLTYTLPEDSCLTVADLTIRHPFPASHSQNVFLKAEADKTRRYGEMCRTHGHHLTVLTIDHYGAWSSGLHKLLDDIIETNALYGSLDTLTHQLTWAAPSMKSYLTQLISCTLQRHLGIKELQTLHRSHKHASTAAALTFEGTNWFRCHTPLTRRR